MPRFGQPLETCGSRNHTVTSSPGSCPHRPARESLGIVLAVQPRRMWQKIEVRRWIQLAFLVGDFALLVAVGIEAALAMHIAHEFVPGVLASTIVGMAVGMGAGLLTALAVRPVLGSIETAVPTMIGGMIGGLAVCLVMLVAGRISGMFTLGIGAATGVVLFSMLMAFDRECRRRFDQDRWHA